MDNRRGAGRGSGGLPLPSALLCRKHMDSTVTITEAQARFPALVRQAQKTGSVMVVRHGRPAAFILSPAQMEGILETMEIIAGKLTGKQPSTASRLRAAPGRKAHK